ncbi:heat shock factor 2-binding protein-like [Plakobranchus ocellatus]|uniref:Heat shock factor 2-binding protein-like n=1 Tax=Plakobranchus ocellatus TaxID=259542 RepID=A0AAV4CJD2_9GAST|nr:heat shock factor 2-binding protein-like [Plakobranchus ocellatus]
MSKISKNASFTILLQDLEKMLSAVAEVRSNLQSLQKDWDEVKAKVSSSTPISHVLTPEDVVVSKQALQGLAIEADQMKTLLPRVINQKFVSASTKLNKLESDLEKAMKEIDELRMEVAHWKTQAETAVTDVQREKRERLELRVDVQELTSQLSQQSEFCSSLGAACCTLLWRVSRQEETIHDIVTGARSVEFLELVSTSVQSYLSAYKDDQWPDQRTDEAIFIVALCGVATNIAASALGREQLASNSQGRQLIDTFVTFVGEAPLNKSANMKVLMLMTLFNISINQKGVKYLQAKPGLMPILAWHVKEEHNHECRANTLRLLLSLVSDEASGLRLMHELKENLPLSVLQQLTTNPQAEVRDLALDLLMDIRRFDSEQ